MISILIVDDQILNREFLVTLLTYCGYKIQEAGNGKEALKIARTNKPALVITDLLMPFMNGYELTQAMQADPDLKNIPVIFYTATYRREEAQLLADSCNVKYVLTKPCEPENILDVVNIALADFNQPEIKIKPESADKRLATLQKKQNRIKFPEYLSQYEDLQHFEHLIHKARANKTRQKLTKADTEELVHAVEELYDFNKQLFSLATLNLDLIAERDIIKLIHTFTLNAKKILDVNFCGFFLVNNQQELIEYFVVGGDNKIRPLLPKSCNDRFIHFLAGHRDIVILNKKDSPDIFPLHQPPLDSLMAMTLYTTSRVYGGLYFSSKNNDDEFNHRDELILRVLAAKISVLIENIDLYNIIQRHATNLQAEISNRKKTEIELKQSEIIFRQFAENIDAVFWRYTPQMDKIIYVSPAYEKIWQRPCDNLYQNPLDWVESVHDDDKQKIMATIASQNKQHNFEFRLKLPDNTFRKIYARTFTVKDNNDEIESIVGIATDVTDLEKSQQQLLIQTNVSKTLSSKHALDMTCHKILDLLCTQLNFCLGEVWMIRKSKMQCMSSLANDSGELEPLVEARKKLIFSPGAGLPGLIWSTQQPIWFNDFNQFRKKHPSLAMLKDHHIHTALGVPIIFHGNVIGAMLFFSKSKLPEDSYFLDLLSSIGIQLGEFISHSHTSRQLNYLVNHDSLTGFLNRLAWEEELNQVIAQKTKKLIAVVVFQIDRFKLILDAVDHDGIDDLIRLIANTVRSNFSLSFDIIARLESDKFAIALTSITNITQINYFASHLISLFKTPFSIKEKEIFITCSAGISIHPQDASDSKALLIKAGVALNRSKDQGGNSFNIYTAHSSDDLKKLELESQLRHAVFEEQFVLHYQPQLNLKNNEIIGFEALIRWQHPERGLLSPIDFLLTLEQSDLIANVGEWVMRKACQQIMHHKMSMAVNLSINHFRSRYNLVNFLSHLLKEIPINPALLELEITEGLLITDISNSLETLKELKNLGVRLSLDDFGTGYCSLNYLKHFAVDKVKIDKSFVEGLPDNQNNKAITLAILALAHSLGVEVIAEGVENQEQYHFLCQAGCDQIQGYYLSRPMPVNEMEIFLHNHNSNPPTG